MYKKNILINIILSFIFLISLLISFNNTKNNFEQERNNSQRTYNYCLENKDKDFCQKIIDNYNKNDIPDAVTFYQIMITNQKSNWLNYTLTIIISITSTYTLCKMFKSQNVINIINRENYNKFKIKNLLKSYLSSLVIIIPIIIIWIIILKNTFNQNYNYAVNYFPIFWHVNYNIYLYILISIMSIILFLLTFTNISLIILRKNQNIALIAIESFLIFIGIDIIIEVLFGWLLSNILFNGFNSNLNIVNILSLGYANNFKEMIMLPMILYVITLIILIFKYINKEKFIIDIEKN